MVKETKNTKEENRGSLRTKIGRALGRVSAAAVDAKVMPATGINPFELSGKARFEAVKTDAPDASRRALEVVEAIASMSGRRSVLDGTGATDRSPRRNPLQHNWLVQLGTRFENRPSAAQTVALTKPLEFIFADGRAVTVNEMSINHAYNADLIIDDPKFDEKSRHHTTIYLNPHSGEDLPNPIFNAEGRIANKVYGDEFRIDIEDGHISVGRKANTASYYQDVSFETQAQANAALGDLFHQAITEIR